MFTAIDSCRHIDKSAEVRNRKPSGWKGVERNRERFGGGTERNGTLGERSGKWSLESRERLKHKKYKVRREGRREVANGQVVPLVANSYGALGAEGRSFLSMLDLIAVSSGRECARERLAPLVQSLVVFLTAQNVLAAFGRESV